MPLMHWGHLQALQGKHAPLQYVYMSHRISLHLLGHILSTVDMLRSALLASRCDCDHHRHNPMLFLRLASGKLSLSDGSAICSQQQSIAEGDEANEAVDEDDDDQPFTRKPFTRTMQKQERDALQKWVQCAKCAKWRKVQHCMCCCAWSSLLCWSDQHRTPLQHLTFLHSVALKTGCCSSIPCLVHSSSQTLTSAMLTRIVTGESCNKAAASIPAACQV